MSILAFLNRHGLWLSWPFFGVGVLLLVFSIVSAVRLGVKSRICDLPLAVQQKVEFLEPAQVVLWLEGPRATSRFAGLSFELTGEGGSAHEGSASLRASFCSLSGSQD